MIEYAGTDTLAAAWSHHEQQEEAAEDRYKRELAAHPLDDYLVEAWSHAFDEPNYELILHLSEQMPVSVLYALCVFSECLPPLNICDGVAREAAQRGIRQWIESWISTEQEALQALAVEEIFP